METTFRVDNQIVQDADRMSKETHLSFRDCLDILVRASLKASESEKSPSTPEYSMM